MSKVSMHQKAIRVAFLDYVPTEIGGRHFALARLANHYYLHDLGVVPTVHSNNFDRFIDRFIGDGVQVEDPFLIPRVVHLPRNFNVFHLMRTSSALMNFLIQFCFKFYRLLKQRQIDVLHVNSMTVFILTALPIKFARKKLIFHMHDTLLSSDEGGNIEGAAQRVLLFYEILR